MPERPRPRTQLPPGGNDRVLVPPNWSSAVLFFWLAERRRASYCNAVLCRVPTRRAGLFIPGGTGRRDLFPLFPFSLICIGSPCCRPNCVSARTDPRRTCRNKKQSKTDNQMRFVTILYLYENKYLHHHFTRNVRFVVNVSVQMYSTLSSTARGKDDKWNQTNGAGWKQTRGFSSWKSAVRKEINTLLFCNKKELTTESLFSPWFFSLRFQKCFTPQEFTNTLHFVS